MEDVQRLIRNGHSTASSKDYKDLHGLMNNAISQVKLEKIGPVFSR